MRNQFLLLFLALLTVADAGNYLAVKPDILTPCTFDDPRFNTCLAKNLQVILTTWKDGVPGTKTVGTWDPLVVKRVKLSQNGNRALSINADMRNVIVRGASQAVVQEVNYNRNQYVLKALMYVPKLSFDFDYKLRGNVLILNLNGEGKGHFDAEKLKMTMELGVKPRTTPEARFADVKHIKIHFPEIGNFKIRLNNLLGGDKQLEDTAHTIFNENWREFYEILQPAIEQAIEAIMLDRFKKILSYVPATYLIDRFA